MAIGIICWFELNQIQLDIRVIDLPGCPEASGADLREGQVPWLGQSWREGKLTS